MKKDEVFPYGAKFNNKLIVSILRCTSLLASWVMMLVVRGLRLGRAHLPEVLRIQQNQQRFGETHGKKLTQLASLPNQLGFGILNRFHHGSL